MNSPRAYAVTLAILAAALFGASAPLAKLLLGEIQPIPLAALLYLGSGVGMLLLRAIQRTRHEASEKEARLSRTDVPWLAGAVVAGGVAAPIVLLFSLRNTPAATASLLLNFEGVATTLIAALVFREAIGRRVWAAIACVTGGSILLTGQTNGEWGISLGALGILTACVLWGMDNNFTRNVSAKDPTAIVATKGISAGLFSLTLAILLGNPFPGPVAIIGGLLLGAISYGLSITLFVRAMRTLGAARTSTFFGAAPFVGAVLSLLFRDNLGVLMLIALPLMLTGAVLLIAEDHVHFHQHAEFEHEHRHSHDDDHHVHTHETVDNMEIHSHVHQHASLGHAHAHTPDIHHRHEHSDKA